MIINASEIKNIYVSNRYIDMRKSIDGLSIIVVSQFNLNVLDHSLFIMNRMVFGYLPEDLSTGDLR